MWRSRDVGPPRPGAGIAIQPLGRRLQDALVARHRRRRNSLALVTPAEDSYAPGGLAEKLLPIHSQSAGGRWTLNYAAHTALGAMWGAPYGVAAHKGLRGARGAAATFAAIYSQDLVMIPALRLGKPWEWSRKDWTIDALDKVVVIASTGAIFDRVFGSKATLTSAGGS